MPDSSLQTEHLKHPHEALNNWTSALDEQARTKSGKEADLLWALAAEKYEAVLKTA